MDFEIYIASLLTEAKENLAYCHEILALPDAARRGYDPTKPVDEFYMTVCNLSFHNALLIVSSLLDAKQSKPISFRNWPLCTDKTRLSDIVTRFEASPLNTVRDKISAHQDADVASVGLILGRRRGIIHEDLVELLQTFLDEIIRFFCDLKPNGNNYAPDVSFDASSAHKEVATVLELAKPKLTGNPMDF